MTVDMATTAIVKVLEDLQRNSGRACAVLTGATTPIGDLDGFDSYSAIEATVMIEAALDCTFKTDNILAKDTPEGRKAVTIAEAAQQVIKLAEPKATR